MKKKKLKKKEKLNLELETKTRKNQRLLQRQMSNAKICHEYRIKKKEHKETKLEENASNLSKAKSECED